MDSSFAAVSSAIKENGNTAEIAVNTITKAVGRIGNRAARFYWSSEKPEMLLASKQGKTSAVQLENPIVATTIAAGVVGVAIILVIILTIWVRSKMPRKENTNLQKNNHSVVSSFSTLYEMEIFEDNQTFQHSENPV